MKKFRYTAVNLQKRKINGSFLAEDENHLRSLLSQQNLYLISCSPMSEKSPTAFLSLSGKLSVAELTSFCRQFAIMINSGISILDSLFILKSQSYSTLLKKVLYMVYEDVKVGLLLSEAMKKHKQVFPEFFHSMVSVGEISGKLDTVLNNLADYYENDAKTKKKIKGALTYPIILLCMIVGIVALMMFFIVPTFRKTLDDMDVVPPPLTQAVYDFSDFLMNKGLTLLLVIIVIVMVLVIYGRTAKGRLAFDTMKMTMPPLRSVTINMLASKFARAFGLLLSSGMDIVDAMDVVCNVLGNRCMQSKFRLAIEQVRQGIPLTLAIENQKIFPDILVQMVAIGEKSGTIDEVLNRSINYFDEQVATSIAAATGLIQPLMMGLMGGVIAIMFIAIYSPMLGIMTGIGK